MSSKVTIDAVIKDSTVQLKHISDTAKLDAQILLAFALGVSKTYLYTWPDRILNDTELQTFDNLLTQRLSNMPIAYITGSKEFWGLEIDVNENVLIPRPDTETLVEAVLNIIPKDANWNLADLGTGSGAIAIAIATERPNLQIYATDISDAALLITQQNIKKHNITNITLNKGSWCHALSQLKFQVILSNPPYIGKNEATQNLQHEPQHALFAEQDGYCCLREIIKTAGAYLTNNGYVFLEHGATQAKTIRDLFIKYNYQKVTTIKDIAKHDRISYASQK
ncbi:MAG: protein-(glutamine-N5) methyltransferase, release factor-specific [Thiotrichales bacterium]|nr:MAG: protein-(glutamine-N5) methyltransferase, release factor-specific [Thiotrichales bacterium]